MFACAFFSCRLLSPPSPPSQAQEAKSSKKDAETRRQELLEDLWAPLADACLARAPNMLCAVQPSHLLHEVLLALPGM